MNTYRSVESQESYSGLYRTLSQVSILNDLHASPILERVHRAENLQCGTVFRSGTGKTTVPPVEMAELLGEVNIKKRQRNRRYEEAPNFFLERNVAMTLWAVKWFFLFPITVFTRE
jgi:hypothetical protein